MIAKAMYQRARVLVRQNVIAQAMLIAQAIYYAQAFGRAEYASRRAKYDRASDDTTPKHSVGHTTHKRSVGILRASVWAKYDCARAKYDHASNDTTRKRSVHAQAFGPRASVRSGKGSKYDRASDVRSRKVCQSTVARAMYGRASVLAGY